jgi:alpha-galactosidase
VSVWRRGGESEIRLPVGHLAGGEARTEILHPSPSRTAGSADWDGDGLRVSLPRTPGVLLIRLTSDG